ncbi:MAG: putative DNA repair helicase RadD [Nitrospira sp.]|nr:putative DNA repair helicase RadD [Nitrospira sp.]
MAGFISAERLALGSWSAFERATARLLQHWGFSDVALVGGTGDLGADVLATAGKNLWLLQCKFRGAGAVGPDGLREAVRAMTAYQASVAVAVTNQNFREDTYRLLESQRAAGLDARLWDSDALLRFWAQLPDVSKARQDLREYQLEAVDAVESHRSKGRRTALVLMATGLGKSVVAGELISRELYRNPEGEILVLAHTVDLVRQLEQAMWPMLSKEVSTHLWTDGEEPAYGGGVTFATWQSVVAGNKRNDLTGRYGMIIVDEAHHAASPQYRSLLESLRPNFMVGVTATPWRGDSKSLQDLFGAPVFSMDILEGMQRGYLAQVDYRMLVDDTDWDEVRNLSREGYSISELNKRLLLPDRDESVIQTVVRHLKDLESPRTIGFCRSIVHAERFRKLLLSNGIRAGVIHSELAREERFSALSRFRTGDLPLLLSVDMLNEGIDVPDVSLVLFLRVTHSRRIFVQQLGRGLRVTPRKSVVRVLDFVADIRRIAAAVSINKDYAARFGDVETVRFPDSTVIRFSNDRPSKFFDEYLADVAAIEDLDDSSRLAYPGRD